MISIIIFLPPGCAYFNQSTTALRTRVDSFVGTQNSRRMNEYNTFGIARRKKKSQGSGRVGSGRFRRSRLKFRGLGRVGSGPDPTRPDPTLPASREAAPEPVNRPGKNNRKNGR